MCCDEYMVYCSGQHMIEYVHIHQVMSEMFLFQLELHGLERLKCTCCHAIVDLKIPLAWRVSVSVITSLFYLEN